jgi:hypothetical protein
VKRFAVVDLLGGRSWTDEKVKPVSGKTFAMNSWHCLLASSVLGLSSLLASKQCHDEYTEEYATNPGSPISPNASNLSFFSSAQGEAPAEPRLITPLTIPTRREFRLLRVAPDDPCADEDHTSANNNDDKTNFVGYFADMEIFEGCHSEHEDAK